MRLGINEAQGADAFTRPRTGTPHSSGDEVAVTKGLSANLGSSQHSGSPSPRAPDGVGAKPTSRACYRCREATSRLTMPVAVDQLTKTSALEDVSRQVGDTVNLARAAYRDISALRSAMRQLRRWECCTLHMLPFLVTTSAFGAPAWREKRQTLLCHSAP